MDEAQFRHALQVGHGRAVLYARSHDVSKFRDIILDACLHCWAVDPTCEGTRSGFMFEVIDKLPDREFYFNEVLKALPADLENWDSVQRFWLACNLVDADDARAKQAMYDAYQPGPRFGESIGNSFIAMDGMKGLLFAAEKIGELLIEGRSDVDLGWLISSAKDKLGEQLVLDTLRSTAILNPRVNAFFKAIEASPDKWPDAEWDAFPNQTYEELKSKIAMPRWWIRLGTWAERASDEEFEKAAHGLLAASDPEEQIGHLKIFGNSPFPLDAAPIFKLAESGDGRIAYAALRALGQRSLPAVRELAFRLIETGSPHRDEAIDLLQWNFEPGDHALALDWFNTETDVEVLHSFQSSLRKLWKKHPEPSSEVAMLLTLYERGPCSFLREFEVRRLLELNALPDPLREECAWDANDDVRDLVDPGSKTDGRSEE